MKQHFYPVRSADNPHRIHLEPISEEVYRAVYPEIWRTQKRMRKSGRCVCPKHKLWACDGDCGLCAYVAAGSYIPLEAPASDSDSSVADAIPDVDTNIEEIIEDMAILDALHDELLRLGPEGRAICKVKGLGIVNADDKM